MKTLNQSIWQGQGSNGNTLNLWWVFSWQTQPCRRQRLGLLIANGNLCRRTSITAKNEKCYPSRRRSAERSLVATRDSKPFRVCVPHNNTGSTRHLRLEPERRRQNLTKENS